MLTEEELTTIIREAVQEAVSVALREANKRHVSKDQLCTRGELAKHLGVTVGHVSNLVKRGLPSIGRTRERRFRIAECEAWLSSRNGQMD